MQQTQFSQQQLFAQAQDNLSGFLAAIFAYTKRHAISFEEWVLEAGALFAPSWDETPDTSPRTIAWQAAMNLASGGADVTVTGDESQAVVETKWPPDDLLALAGATREEFAPFFAIFAPIAERLGLRYNYVLDGDCARLNFAR